MSYYEGVPERMGNLNEWCFRLAQTVNNIMRGRTNNVYEVTLDAGVTSTDVILPKGVLSNDSAILFDPLTANAAAALYGGSMYVLEADRDVAAPSFTITHANAGSTDRKFRYVIVG